MQIFSALRICTFSFNAQFFNVFWFDCCISTVIKLANDTQRQPTSAFVYRKFVQEVCPCAVFLIDNVTELSPALPLTAMNVFENCTVLLDLKNTPSKEKKRLKTAVTDNGGSLCLLVNTQVTWWCRHSPLPLFPRLGKRKILTGGHSS